MPQIQGNVEFYAGPHDDKDHTRALRDVVQSLTVTVDREYSVL
ncbi:MAG: hypothetical protein O6941_00875 [Planctomycetota bacterium]|nr:hypothetical protein [Planctomycetota bacterium]MCZ6850818.1 hypothetical protein [Planctomycetota bacterium]